MIARILGLHHHSDGLTSRAVFGAFDGATSSIGVVAGLLATASTPTAIVATAAALAVASMVGMASGDYLSGATRAQAAVMGAATFVGSLLPAIPLAVSRSWPGYTVATALLIALGAAISEARPAGRVRAYATTFSILLVASGLSIGAALLVGAA